MPYFKNNDINLLFIHIPKTGGTTIEEYLYPKYNIPKNVKSLWLHGPLFNHSYQHCSYNEIMDNKKKLGIDEKNLKIFAVVRNPYTRLISELFYRNLINKNNNKNEVYVTIKNYLNGKNSYDNHRNPQYLFLINKEGIIEPEIVVMRTESLNKDMESYGFDDFYKIKSHNTNNKVKGKEKEKIDYFDYLNEMSIKLINEYYEKDFKYFNYDMIYQEKKLSEEKKNIDFKNIDLKNTINLSNISNKEKYMDKEVQTDGFLFEIRYN